MRLEFSARLRELDGEAVAIPDGTTEFWKGVSMVMPKAPVSEEHSKLYFDRIASVLCKEFTKYTREKYGRKEIVPDETMEI